MHKHTHLLDCKFIIRQELIGQGISPNCFHSALSRLDDQMISRCNPMSQASFPTVKAHRCFTRAASLPMIIAGDNFQHPCLVAHPPPNSVELTFIPRGWEILKDPALLHALWMWSCEYYLMPILFLSLNPYPPNASPQIKMCGAQKCGKSPT